jgi:hypothetical protein
MPYRLNIDNDITWVNTYANELIIYFQSLSYTLLQYEKWIVFISLTYDTNDRRSNNYAYVHQIYIYRERTYINVLMRLPSTHWCILSYVHTSFFLHLDEMNDSILRDIIPSNDEVKNSLNR